MNRSHLRIACGLLALLPVLASKGQAQILMQPGNEVDGCRHATAISPAANENAQVKPALAWVRSPTQLRHCKQTSTSLQRLLPGYLAQNPLYCRRLRNSAVDGINYRYLDQGLVAFEQPGGELHYYQGQPDGPAGGAVVEITQSPAQTQKYGDRDWLRVKYTSRAQTQRFGWVALGSPNGLRSIANCLPGQGLASP